MKMIRWQIEILKIFNWIQLNRLRKDEANMQKKLKYFEEACTLERKISFWLEIHTENNSHSYCYASFALVILFVFDKLGERNNQHKTGNQVEFEAKFSVSHWIEFV